MKHQWRNFRSFVMRLSHQERRKAKLATFRRELERYRNMEPDELHFEYISVKSEYEHQKMVLTVFIVSIAIALLMNIWGKFLSFMEMVLQYVAMEGADTLEVTQVSFWIALSVSLFFSILILFFLFSISKKIDELRKRVMLIDTVLSEKTHSER